MRVERQRNPSGLLVATGWRVSLHSTRPSLPLTRKVRLRRQVDWFRPRSYQGMRSGDDCKAALVLRLLRSWRGRQLQHSRMLPLTQPGDEHSVPVGEFECVVMYVRLLLVD